MTADLSLRKDVSGGFFLFRGLRSPGNGRISISRIYTANEGQALARLRLSGLLQIMLWSRVSVNTAGQKNRARQVHLALCKAASS